MEFTSDDIVQIHFKLHLCTGENHDTISVARERKILPAFMEWFSASWFAREFPQNENDLPKGVKAAQHFVTFDKKKGLVLCLGYYIDHQVVRLDDKFKEVLRQIVDDVERQFSDGWGESFEQRSMKHGKARFWPSLSTDIVRIVVPVMENCRTAVFWKSIEEIEHAGWMTYFDNDIFNILYNRARHEQKVREADSQSLRNIYQYVDEHKHQFIRV